MSLEGGLTLVVRRCPIVVGLLQKDQVDCYNQDRHQSQGDEII